jgi:hypothetical protein
MFQTSAMADTNALLFNKGINTTNNDYQSDSLKTKGMTKSVTSNTNKNSDNENAKISSLNENVVGYNQSGTLIEMSSSYVHPGDLVNINVNSSEVNNFVYTNGFTYSVQAQDGEKPYDVTTAIPLNNGSVANNSVTNFQQTWENQQLAGQISYNSTSYSKLYGVSVQNIVHTPVNPTSEKITWQTIGNTTSILRFGTSTTLSTYTEKSIPNFRNDHTLYLTTLLPNTTYYYQVLGLDYFGRTINSSINSFTTSIDSVNVVITSPVEFLGTTSTETTIKFTTNVRTDVSILWGYTRDEVNSGNTYAYVIDNNNTDHSFTFNGRNPGTEYFFKINITETTNATNTKIYDNSGLYYSFITSQNVYTLTNFVPTINTTTSEATVTFSTNTSLKASLIYSIDPNFVSYEALPFDIANETHTFTFAINRAIFYYMKINITFNDVNYYVSVSSVISIQIESPFVYYTITKDLNTKDANQDIHSAYFSLNLEIPKYPAVLGLYQFSLTLNRTLNQITQTVSSYVLGTVTFIVNDTLLFTPTKSVIQRGTFTNVTGSFPLWMNNTNTIYSPTDNVAFIGSVAYSTSPSTPIDRKYFSASGVVNLYFNGEKISSGETEVRDLPELATAVNQLNLNGSIFTGLNENTTKVINVNIPAKDIYGNLVVEMAITFKHQIGLQWVSHDYLQNSNLTNPLDVKYRLGVLKSTGESSYSLTTTDLVGSATILPYQYENIEQTYSSGNVTNFIAIPGSELNIVLSVKHNSVAQSIFEFERQNYTWFWFRQTLESSLETGNYQVNLLWTGKDSSSRANVSTLISLYDSNPVQFSYTFSLDVSFTVKDLTANITLKPGQKQTLRFKIIVPLTKIAWDQDLEAKVDGNPALFDSLTGEYRYNITAGSTDGTTSLTVELGKLSDKLDSNNKLTFIVNSTEKTTMSINTQSQFDVDISLTGFAFIGFSIVGSVLYIGYILITGRKK